MRCKKKEKEEMQIEAINKSVNSRAHRFLNKHNTTCFHNFRIGSAKDSFVKVANSTINNNASFKGRLPHKQSMTLLNKCISGYTNEKETLTKILLEPLIRAEQNPSVSLPPSILLHGSEALLINKLVDGVAGGLSKICNCTIHDISEIPQEKLISVLTQILEDNAKSKNIQIIRLNNSEKYLGMSYNQAKRLLDFSYNNEERNILQSNNNTELINYFKSLLDNCSRPQQQGGSRSVFLFTTQNPHLIHPDFRKGKMEKIQFSPPHNEDVFKLLFDLIEDNKDKLARRFRRKANYHEIIEKLETLDLQGLSEKQKEDIKSCCIANIHDGAFSYEDLNNIAANACMRTITNKAGFSGTQCLDVELFCAEKSIKPEDVLRNKKISELFQHKLSLYEHLRAKEEAGDIKREEIALLNDLIEHRRFEKYKLETKAQKKSLNCFEQDYLDELNKDAIY